MNQRHKSLFGCSNPATLTEKLEEETQRRSEQLAEEDERKLHQYEVNQNQLHKSLFGSSHSLFG